MSLSEFSIISRYFQKEGLQASPDSNSIKLGIGDDCALIKPSQNYCLAVSLDVLNEGVHFPVFASPDLIAQRALAVNLSDLAAMGARPLGFTLGLSLPDADEAWLEKFSQGLLLAARKYHCPLIGGDLTKGYLSIAIQVHGEVEEEKALTRSGAMLEDLIFVSGTLGAASAALRCLESKNNSLHEEKLLEKYYCPTPRLALGMALSCYASSCIDISDGLLADLEHLAESSSVGMELEEKYIPVNELLNQVDIKQSALTLALTGGDDYELAFTLPPQHRDKINEIANQSGCQLTCIGKVVSKDTHKKSVVCLNESGGSLDFTNAGYTHF